MDWIGCRRAGVHAWLVTHFVLPVDGVLDTHRFHILILFGGIFGFFLFGKSVCFCFGLRLILSFWTREVLSAVRLCVPRSRLLRWQGRLLSGFHFDTTSPLRFVLPSTILSIPSSSSSSSSAHTHCLFLLSGHGVQPPGQAMQCRI